MFVIKINYIEYINFIFHLINICIYLFWLLIAIIDYSAFIRAIDK
jgi:hypothetical protein